MEFKIGKKQFWIQKRTSIIASVFVMLLMIIWCIGLIGPSPNAKRVVFAVMSWILLGYFLFQIRKDYFTTKKNMEMHRLIIENNKLVLTQGAFKHEIDLQKIDSIHFKYKKKSIKSIQVTVSKDHRFKITGYENMPVIMRLIKEATPAAKIKK